MYMLLDKAFVDVRSLPDDDLWLVKISSVSTIVCFRYFPRKHVNTTREVNPQSSAGRRDPSGH